MGLTAQPWDVNDPHGLYESGTATSASNTFITDSTKSWTTNQWAGYSVKRVSDGATATITGNSNNTLQIVSWLNENWTGGHRYEIRKVLIIFDQPGRGRGDLIIGNPPCPLVGRIKNPSRVIRGTTFIVRAASTLIFATANRLANHPAGP